MKTAGRRITRPSDWDEVRRLQRMVEALRRTSKLVPRGVYRFRSFEEADAWMTRMTARTHARHSPKISPRSAER